MSFNFLLKIVLQCYYIISFKERGSTMNKASKFILCFSFIAILASGFISQLLNIKQADINFFLFPDDEQLANNLSYKETLIKISGLFLKTFQIADYYSDKNVYILDNDYIISASAKTSTDYEFNQLVSFKQFLDENDINLVYVNQPTKYIDDSIFIDNFGIPSFCNQNADLLLSRLSNAGFTVLDLRDNIREEKLSTKDLFYRTDHHWTVPAGFWAAKHMANTLNQTCNYSIDLNLYNPNNYTFIEHPNYWIGEQGQLVSKAYIGKDDYTVVKPNFPTRYLLKEYSSYVEGTFDDFIYQDQIDNHIETDSALHYAYRLRSSINLDINDGKILFICDSYGHVTEPFLSLGVHQIDRYQPRDDYFPEGLRNHILANNYDTVIIAYAEFMIGAHDDPNSSNYRMFDFDQ